MQKIRCVRCFTVDLYFTEVDERFSRIAKSRWQTRFTWVVIDNITTLYVTGDGQLRGDVGHCVISVMVT